MAKDTCGLWVGGSQAPCANQTRSHQSLPKGFARGYDHGCAASTAGREQAAACTSRGHCTRENPHHPGADHGTLALFPDPGDHPRLCHKKTTSRLKRQNAPAAPRGSAPLRSTGQRPPHGRESSQGQSHPWGPRPSGGTGHREGLAIGEGTNGHREGTAIGERRTG